MKGRDRAAIIYSSRAGIGGLGHSAAVAITALAQANNENNVLALGPGRSLPWSLPGPISNVTWIESPAGPWPWLARYSWLRWRSGDLTFLRDASLGRWAARKIQESRPSCCYLLPQVALETLRCFWQYLE